MQRQVCTVPQSSPSTSLCAQAHTLTRTHTLHPLRTCVCTHTHARSHTLTQIWVYIHHAGTHMPLTHTHTPPLALKPPVSSASTIINDQRRGESGRPYRAECCHVGISELC